jgi:hypothetical protein
MRILFNIISKKINWTQNQSLNLNFENTYWPDYLTQDENLHPSAKTYYSTLGYSCDIAHTFTLISYPITSHYVVVDWLLYLHSKFTKK